MTGRVCEKHQEYCPDGNCRWCEPEVASPAIAGLDYWTQPNVFESSAYGELKVCDDGAIVNRRGRSIADNISKNNLLLKYLREKHKI